jgi:hypothetical protein
MGRFGPLAVAAALLVTAALSSTVPAQPAPALPFAARGYPDFSVGRPH